MTEIEKYNFKRALDITRNKILRGEIICLLYSSYGTTVCLDTIRQVVRRFGYADQDVKKALAYLGDSQTSYIRRDLRDEEYWHTAAELTAKGVNLFEGDITDDGVILSD